ncbi:RNA polymerase sigma-54 factor RpoN [Candidatus Symbiothrix dinenymphae]|nr:RNA polymerase sigma-54 factor RpoN [Candidatus Symbiothrix dinenymphae]
MALWQQQTLKQQQKLSPLQIQQVKMLELTALEMQERIIQELEENPALELDADLPDEPENALDEAIAPTDEEAANEDLTLGDYLTEDDVPDYAYNQATSHEQRTEIPYSETESFHEYLLGQLQLKKLSERATKIAEYLVGNLEDDGYLRRTLGDISNDLLFQYSLDVSVAELRDVLTVVQTLDPAGLGATDLQQCLLLQLQRKETTPERQNARKLLETCFEAFAKKQYDKIMRMLNISEAQLKQAVSEITALNPKPGSAWESATETKMAHITPDFTVETINGKPILSMLEQNVPELHISRDFQEMLTQYATNADAAAFVKQKTEAARWFIDAIKQRQNTLRNTMEAIMSIQEAFFLTGEESNLKPMILKDVAERAECDISTVSRVVNSKYVQTNWGVYLLKYFFAEGLTNDQGEKVSTREIKAILKDCVEAEDKSKPLSDDALQQLLVEKGYDVARRTVAKYREMLNIPVARLRKNF